MSMLQLISRAVFFWCFLAGGAMEASAQVRPVGKAVSIVQQVVQSNASGGGGAALSSGDSIYHGRQLRASASSRGEFELQDETRLVLNANSSLLLDDLVVGGSGSFAKLSLNAVSGAFRFISGNSPSEAYKISTAVSTLGIRGTAFDVYVGRGGETAVMLLRGRVQICRRDGVRTEESCEELSRRCQIALSERASDNVELLDSGQQTVAGVALEAAFPFAANQSVLNPEFRVRGASSCLSRRAILRDRLRIRQQLRLTRQASIPPPPDVNPPPPDDEPPSASGNPGTSGTTPGASRSSNSNASDRARSSPGNSGSSKSSNSQSRGNSGKDKKNTSSSGSSSGSKGKSKGKGKS